MPLPQAETPVRSVTPLSSQSPPCKQIYTQREAYKNLSIFPRVVYNFKFYKVFSGFIHKTECIWGKSDVRERRYISQDEKGWGSSIVEYGTRMWALDPTIHILHAPQTDGGTQGDLPQLTSPIARKRVSSYLDPPVKITKRLDTS